MLSEGQIETFSDIFKFIKKTVVANDLGLNVARFGRLIEDVENFRMRDIFRLAELFNLTPTEIFVLLLKQSKLKKKK